MMTISDLGRPMAPAGFVVSVPVDRAMPGLAVRIVHPVETKLPSLPLARVAIQGEAHRSRPHGAREA